LNERPSADQFLTLAEVSRAVASILDLDTLLDEVVSIIRRQFGYPFVHLYIVDPVRNLIIYRAGSGARSRIWQERGLTYSLDAPEGIIPWVARNGRTVIANDVSLDPRYRAAEVAVGEGSVAGAPVKAQKDRAPSSTVDGPVADTRAELTVPLIFGDHVLGVLDVQSDRRGAFDEDDRLLFEALADSVAIAIRNANLYRSERWRRQVADSLHEVAGLLSEDVLLTELLDTILVELERTLPCDLAAIWLLEDDELHVAAIRGPDVYAFTADTILPTAAGHPASDGPPEPAGPEMSTWVSQSLSSERPIIRSPESPPDPLGETLEFPSDHSAIAVPLRVGDQRLGLLTLAHRSSGQYGAESQAVMATFASYAAVAIENTRLYQEAQEQALVSTVMFQVAEASQSLSALDQVLEAVAQLASQLTSENRAARSAVAPCAIYLWDDAMMAFVPAAAYGLSPDQMAAFASYHVALGDVRAFDELLATGAPTVLCADTVRPAADTLRHATTGRADTPRPAEDGSQAAMSALGFESLLLLPLLSQGSVLGTMLVECQDDLLGSETSESLLDQRMVILQGIAHQAAAAVENARLREAQQAEAYVSAALLQVSQAVNTLNELDDILTAVVRITPILVGIERCLLYLWDEGDEVFRLAQAYGLSREEQAALCPREYGPGSFGLLDEVRTMDSLVACPLTASPADTVRRATAGRPDAVRTTNVQASLPLHERVPRELATILPDIDREGHGSLLAVPLSVRGEVLGAMLLVDTHSRAGAGAQGLLTGAGYTSGMQERRIEILTGIAHQAAMAVQNERFQQERLGRERLERELQLAREIQQIFIPSHLPLVHGWELAAMWRAARQVAGDFYDLIELPGKKLGLVVADVADKGMPAALFMALTRTLVRAAASEETSAAAVLMRVNDLLVPDAQRGMFVTAAYAILSLETGELHYANAGHCLPLMLRSGSRTLERLPKGGTALGVLADLSLQEHATTMAPGDSLILYTDGITEAFSPRGELFGERRLFGVMQTIAQTANSCSAQALLEIVLTSVQTFTEDAPASDDLTAVVLQRIPLDRS
jgi:sigma-B regulation protein RsbU (phosphoserine phosphatase)